MRESEHGRRWFWATLVLSSISIIALVFAFWELVENHYFPIEVKGASAATSGQ